MVSLENHSVLRKVQRPAEDATVNRNMKYTVITHNATFKN